MFNILLDLIMAWTFAFGSNMSISHVEKKKGHKVLEHVTGVVYGYRMCFNIAGASKVRQFMVGFEPKSFIFSDLP